jgi:class 3 adenylate cyclase
MESNTRNYTSDDSDARIREILDAPRGNYEEVDDIPSRARLTYDNGFYVKCAAVFIDIRGSSSLPDLHSRPVLGKIYRAYISECIAVLNRYSCCKEIYVAGDCVSGIFNTSTGTGIQEAFNAACALNSQIQHLNYRLEQKGYTPISCGIGVSYGRALMVKSGYSGSGLNEVVWMGDVVNQASNLCHQGNRNGRAPVQVACEVYDRLGQHDRQLMKIVFSPAWEIEHYEGDVVNVAMADWLRERRRVDTRQSVMPNALLGLPQFPISQPYFGLASLALPPPPKPRTGGMVKPYGVSDALVDALKGGSAAGPGAFTLGALLGGTKP